MEIPESIKCGICADACKRGVKTPCCSAIACRACATKSITRNKLCWNQSCAKAMRTSDLINDEALRDAVDKFQTERKQGAAKQKELQDQEQEENKTINKSVVQAEEKEEQKSASNGTNNEKSDNVIKPTIIKEISLIQMLERNEEFNKCMMPDERSCNELRYGAMLELMFDFQFDKAVCLLCSESVKSEFMILKHIQLKHKKEYDQMKTVLKTTNLNTLNMFIHKAIRSEFLYQQKKIFPIEISS